MDLDIPALLVHGWQQGKVYPRHLVIPLIAVMDITVLMELEIPVLLGLGCLEAKVHHRHRVQLRAAVLDTTVLMDSNPSALQDSIASRDRRVVLHRDVVQGAIVQKAAVPLHCYVRLGSFVLIPLFALNVRLDSAALVAPLH
jgi:hypothetical protein